MTFHFDDKAWEASLEELKKYKRQEGHCMVPARFQTETGKKLGFWVKTQRLNYSEGKMPQDRIDALNAIGFCWSLRELQSWQKMFELLKQFKEEHGHCIVPAKQGQLGEWVHTQRKLYKKNKLSDDRIIKLKTIGFVWDATDTAWQRNTAWQRMFILLEQYKEEHGTCLVPQGHEVLGEWVHTHRLLSRDMSEYRYSKLDSIGFFKDASSSNGNGIERDPPFIVESPQPTRHQAGHNNGPSTPVPPNARISETSIPAPKKRKATNDEEWQQGFALLKQYKEEHGNCLVPFKHEILGPWVHQQRQYFNETRLPADRIIKLNSIGFAWWDAACCLGEAREWVDTSFDEPPQPARGQTNNNTAATCLGAQVIPIMNTENTMGSPAFSSPALRERKTTSDEKWQKKFELLKQYKKKHNNCLVPKDHPTLGKLGRWVFKQHYKYTKNKLSDDRIFKLNSIGFVWGAPHSFCWSKVWERVDASSCGEPPQPTEGQAKPNNDAESCSAHVTPDSGNDDSVTEMERIPLEPQNTTIVERFNDSGLELAEEDDWNEMDECPAPKRQKLDEHDDFEYESSAAYFARKRTPFDTFTI